MGGQSAGGTPIRGAFQVGGESILSGVPPAVWAERSRRMRPSQRKAAPHPSTALRFTPLRSGCSADLAPTSKRGRIGAPIARRLAMVYSAAIRSSRLHCRLSRRRAWRRSSRSPSPPASAAATSLSGGWPRSARRSSPAPSPRCCRSSIRTIWASPRAGSPSGRPSTPSGTRINDPLFGYITDSTRSKRGRRIPYMRFTAPFLALTFILVWLAPKGALQPALFCLDAGHDAALRHVLHHHRAGLFRPAA